MNYFEKNKLRVRGFFVMSSSNIVENFPRIVSYCKKFRRKDQIMTAMNFSDLETEAYTTILIHQRLIEHNFNKYQTTMKGNSYLDTRTRIEVALRRRF